MLGDKIMTNKWFVGFVSSLPIVAVALLGVAPRGGPVPPRTFAAPPHQAPVMPVPPHTFPAPPRPAPIAPAPPRTEPAPINAPVNPSPPRSAPVEPPRAEPGNSPPG